MTPEGRVKEAIRRALRRHGAWWYMPVPHSAYGRAVVDFLCCIDGVFVAIEAKAPGRKPTARQKACLAEIEAHGGLAAVVDRAEDAERIVARLVEAARKRRKSE